MTQTATMTYHVHLYREMRLSFEGIEADSPDRAARRAADWPAADAVDIDDCAGESFGALVAVAGDEEHVHSCLIDFEGDRLRKAAPALLAALQEVLEEITYHHADLLTEDERRHPRGNGWARVYDKGTAAVAQAQGTGA